MPVRADNKNRKTVQSPLSLNYRHKIRFGLVTSAVTQKFHDRINHYFDMLVDFISFGRNVIALAGLKHFGAMFVYLQDYIAHLFQIELCTRRLEVRKNFLEIHIIASRKYFTRSVNKKIAPHFCETVNFIFYSRIIFHSWRFYNQAVQSSCVNVLPVS